MALLKIGEKAPVIAGRDQFGNEIDLNQLKGKKVVVYFYPKDDTPGCTEESCNLRDNHAELQKKGFVVIGISADSEKSHKKFSSKYNLPFSLIPDEDKNIIKAYGVWGKKKMFGKSYDGILRTTYVISEEGLIELVIDNVDKKDHTNQILKELEK